MSELTIKLIELGVMGLLNSVIIAGWFKICYYETKSAPVGYPQRDEMPIDEDSKEVFWRLRYFFSKFVSPWYMKPLFTCVICMASVHGAWFYWLCQPFTLDALKWFAPYLIGLAGYNYVYLSSRI